MHQPVKSAVIAAAGSATRMWPASKAIPKELFPIGRSPAILYILQELADAGVEQVVVVTGEGSSPLVRFLDPARLPPDKVRDAAPVQELLRILDRLRIAFTPQRGPYGNGTPLLNALDVLGDRPCIYVFADDVVLGENVSERLVRSYQATGAPGMAAQPVPEDRVSKFGIAETVDEGGHLRITRMLEKPAPGETSSRLATFGRYLVTPELVSRLRATTVGKGGELWFTDAVVRHLADGHPVHAVPLTTGAWHTVGDPVGYAAAVTAAATLGDGCPLF